MAMSWRLRDLRVHTALGLYDASSAFCCVAHSDLDTQTLVQRIDYDMHCAQHRQQVLTVGAADGEVTMRAGQGVLMGHALGPIKFVRAYNEALKEWSDALALDDVSYGFMLMRDLVSQELVDGSLTVFVDDIGKRQGR